VPTLGLVSNPEKWQITKKAVAEVTLACKDVDNKQIERLLAWQPEPK
jgi:hypothetical protein